MNDCNNESLQTISVADVYFELMEKLFDRNIQCDRIVDEKTAAKFFNLSYDGAKFQKLIAMKFFKVLSEIPMKASLSADIIHKFENKLGKMHKLTVSLLSENEREAEIINRIDQKHWGSFSGKYLSYQLSVLNWMLRNDSGLLLEQRPNLLELVTESLETGGKESLIECLELAKTLMLPCVDFLQLSHRYIFEFRKNEIFWPALCLFSQLCLLNLTYCISNHSDLIIGIFLSLIQESENVSGILPLLMVEIEQYCCQLEVSLPFTTLIPVLARAITYGPVYR